MEGIKLFACPYAEKFTQDIANSLGLQVSKCNVMKFANDNSFCQYEETVRGQDVYIVCQAVPNINDRVMESLIMIDAAKRASAKTINLVLPYFNYSRTDKKDQPRVPVTASMLARVYETVGIDRVITCDLHNPAINAFFTIPCDIVSAHQQLENCFKTLKSDKVVVVATDAGSTKAAYKHAKALNVPVAMIDKRREANDDRAIASTVVGDVKDRICIMFDDEVSTAGTLCEAAKILKEQGAKTIFAACTHGVLCGPAIERIEQSEIKKLLITDSIPLGDKKSDKILIESIAPMFAETIRRIHNNQSLAGMLQ